MPSAVSCSVDSKCIGLGNFQWYHLELWQAVAEVTITVLGSNLLRMPRLQAVLRKLYCLLNYRFTILVCLSLERSLV